MKKLTEEVAADFRRVADELVRRIEKLIDDKIAAFEAKIGAKLPGRELDEAVAKVNRDYADCTAMSLRTAIIDALIATQPDDEQWPRIGVPDDKN
jgi:hypothetical protein